MLASLPYTTAMLLTLFLWINSLSVSFSSSATKPINELSGVWAAKNEHSNGVSYMAPNAVRISINKGGVGIIQATEWTNYFEQNEKGNGHYKELKLNVYEQLLLQKKSVVDESGGLLRSL